MNVDTVSTVNGFAVHCMCGKSFRSLRGRSTRAVSVTEQGSGTLWFWKKRVGTITCAIGRLCFVCAHFGFSWSGAVLLIMRILLFSTKLGLVVLLNKIEFIFSCWMKLCFSAYVTNKSSLYFQKREQRVVQCDTVGNKKGCRGALCTAWQL